MNLDESNFILYAAKYYDNINCSSYDEFEDDLKRIKYLKKLFKKYRDTGELKVRLILNHLIILYNVFEHTACTNMLCFKLFDYLDLLKPFLIFLSFWPNTKNITVGNVTTPDCYINIDR